MKNLPLAKKALSIFTRKQKVYSVFIFTMMFVTMIAETLSVGIIIPLLSIFLKGEIGTGIFAIPFNLAEMLGENLLYIGLVVTLIIFLSKNLLLIFNLILYAFTFIFKFIFFNFF